MDITNARSHTRKVKLSLYWYTVVPLLYRCAETHSAATSHLRFNIFVNSWTFATREPLYATKTTHCKQETFLPLHSVFCPKKKHNRTLLFGSIPSRTIAFWVLKPGSEQVHACLLPRLSWSWTVLLPSDTYRKPITSITAVILQFKTYLLTLPRK